MTSDHSRLLSRLQVLREEANDAAAVVSVEHKNELEEYRAAITRGVTETLERIQAEVSEISGGSAICVDLTRQTAEYIDWLQWTFWDLPHFAVALRLPPERLASGVASCGLVYLAIRIFDDVIDRHYIYKQKHSTLLSMLEEPDTTRRNPDGLSILAGLLMCFEGLSRITESDSPAAGAMMRSTVQAARRTVIGLIMEQAAPEKWDDAAYRKLIYLKNVEFWKSLFSAIDPDGTSRLFPILQRYYALAQKLNDVRDYPQDLLRAQPNLVLLRARKRESDSNGNASLQAALVDVEEEVARDILELGEAASGLPRRESLVMLTKLGETIQEAQSLGLFHEADPADSATPAVQSDSAPLGLEWYSTLEEVLAKAGPAALCDVVCAGCGSESRRHLFIKQGFSFHRCLECSHVYVSPRIHADLSSRLAAELEAVDCHSNLLEVQKYYAAPICHLLRYRAPGSRFLDVGFGRGYLLELAKSYGFEVYGVETSSELVDVLRPAFGKRLAHAAVGDGKLPWGSFDVIVVSHVLEHLEKPAQFLERVLEALNPEGILYVAVPDIQSVQFQVFGKKWDVISPLSHFQYFNEASLMRLLKQCGFVEPERVQQPQIPEEIAPRWLRLMRRIGSSDSGELAILAARPPAP